MTYPPFSLASEEMVWWRSSRNDAYALEAKEDS